MSKQFKSSFIASVVVILTFVLSVEPSYARWPPFDFKLIPSYTKDQITYKIEFKTRNNWVMTNLTFKIPIPEGTRFVRADTNPATQVSFSGSEVNFFYPNYGFSREKPNITIDDISFMVEVIDPNRINFVNRAWISWEGDQPGNFLTDEVVVDITRPYLEWQEPSPPDLQLVMNATVADDIVSYNIYVRNIRYGRNRMFDVKINVPIPAGTTFLSAEGPPSFVSSFNGSEVSFTTIELPQRVNLGPLVIKVSTAGVQTPQLGTHAWATWKNSSRNVGLTIESQGETSTPDILVQRDANSQWVALDRVGDVPLPNYDLSSIGFEGYVSAFKVIFYTVEDLGPIGQPLELTLFVDLDCNAQTGQPDNKDFGFEYRVIYSHKNGQALVKFWDLNREANNKWRYIEAITIAKPVNNKMVALWVPYEALGLKDNVHFCWKAVAGNNSTAFASPLPIDQVFPYFQDLQLTMSQVPPLMIESSESDQPASGNFFTIGDTWRYLIGLTTPALDWTKTEFDDSEWPSGPTSIGYGDNYATNLSFESLSSSTDNTPVLVQQRIITEAGMVLAVLPSNDVNSFLMRRIFLVDNPAVITQLTLQVKYEGGFIAYLNGIEVARRGLGEVGSPVAYNSVADIPKAKNKEAIDLSNYISNLVTGTNVLAIQVHRAADRVNFSMGPELSWKSDLTNIISVDTPNESEENLASAPPESFASSLPPVPVTEISGKLAVPLDNGYVSYDIHIFSLPGGQELISLPNARQPNFRFDGQRLLINREGGGAENVYEYSLAEGIEKQVSDAPRDAHPFYDLYGNRVVYGNAELTYGRPELVYKENKWYYTGVHKPFIFVQCGLMPPHQEKEPRCRDIPSLGVLVPAGQMGEIQGTHPVWTSNDMIAYKGCNTWAGSRLCGIYSVPSASTKGFSDGFIPRQLTQDTSDIPSDTKGNLIAFTSHRDGNWEAYVMDLNGDGTRNLSNSPDSDDGLPTLSPDGYWVAFVSNRGGQWAIWAVPAAGGEAQKLFNLPTNTPWGAGDRDWVNERISWGP